MAEQGLNRDIRVRRLVDHGILSVTGDDTVLPSAFSSVESWYHDGPTFRGPIEIVNPDRIGQLKRRHGATGAPAFAAIIEGIARYAPAPDGTFSTEFVYWEKVPPLTGAAPTNWLLDDHADIYIYATLLETAPYLKDDARIAVWQSVYDQGAELLHRATEDEQFSGTLRRQYRPIGG